jgi:hypothetical protein
VEYATSAIRLRISKNNANWQATESFMRSLFPSVVAFLLVLGLVIGGSFWLMSGGDSDAIVADLTGDWAIDFVEPSQNLEETFLINLRHDGDEIFGTALDPDLIRATIKGTAKSGRIEFLCEPSRRAPDSVFVGKATGENTMEGTWQLTQKDHLLARRRKGTWSARRLAAHEIPKVTVGDSTVLEFTITSQEYKLIGPSPGARKVREGYEVQMSVDNLRRHYRHLGDLNRIDGQTPPERFQARRRMQSRIQEILNQNGYPWNLDPSSRTLLIPKD